MVQSQPKQPGLTPEANGIPTNQAKHGRDTNIVGEAQSNSETYCHAAR
jgi:hypothetical protein